MDNKSIMCIGSVRNLKILFHDSIRRNKSTLKSMRKAKTNYKARLRDAQQNYLTHEGSQEHVSLTNTGSTLTFPPRGNLKVDQHNAATFRVQVRGLCSLNHNNNSYPSPNPGPNSIFNRWGGRKFED